MKKVILTLSFLFTAIITSAQSVNLADSTIIKFPVNSDNEIAYTEVSNTKLSKEQLFKNAQTWIAKNYGSYKAVVQVDDLATGNIIFKGKSVLDKSGNNIMDALTYTVQLDFKTDKYRIVISDISVYQNLSFMPLGQKEKSETFASYYQRQINRKDDYNNLVPSQIREKDNQVKSLIKELQKGLAQTNDF